GALVRPEDIRRGIERIFEQGTNSYLEGIVGAARCAARPGQQCDLSQGIIANALHDTVTFHLVARDPEFLDKLAVPGAFAVPAGTPAQQITKLPPATGPYVIRSATAKRIEFVRNPYFRSPARPRGYVDRILIRNTGNTPLPPPATKQ